MHRRLVILLLAVFHLFFTAAANDWNEELFRAVQESDLPGVETALAAGADIDSRRETNRLLSDVPERGFTPLMVAARDSNLEVVTLLLEAGANPHLRGSEYGQLIDPTSGPEFVEYRTALLLAAEHNPDPQVSLALLRAGAWPDTTTEIFAGRRTGLESSRFPYPDAVITRTYSPIGLALERNPNPRVAAVLKEHALTLRFPDVGWQHYLLYAAKYGTGVLVGDFLDAGVDVDDDYYRLDLPLEPRHTVTALHGAVESGNFETARKLIEAGTDVNALADDHGYTPLISAVLQDQVGMVELLLEAGADPQAGRNALFEALANEVDAVILDLLSTVTEVGPADEAAAEVLLQAVGNEEAGRVRGLLNLYQFEEPILTAALRRALYPVVFGRWDYAAREQMVEELIEAGADATVAPPTALPPSDYETDYGDQRSVIMGLFPDLYAVYFPSHSIPSNLQRLELLMLLLDAGLEMPERVLTLLQEEAESNEYLSESLKEHGFHASDF